MRLEDDVLVDFEIEKRRLSYLFRYENDGAHEIGVVDMFNTNIAVRYDIFLLENPPYFIYVFIEFSKYRNGKIDRIRKEFLADRIFDSEFNSILSEMAKVKNIEDFRKLFRELVVEKRR